MDCSLPTPLSMEFSRGDTTECIAASMVKLVWEGGMTSSVPTEGKTAHIAQLRCNHWPVFHSWEAECQPWWHHPWGARGRGIGGRERRGVRQEPHSLVNPRRTRRPGSCEPEGFLAQGSEKQLGLPESAIGGPQRQEKGTDGRRNTQGPGGTRVSRLTGWDWEGERGKMIDVDTVRLPPK